MKMTLNIGLAREGKPNLTADQVKTLVARRFSAGVYRVAVYESDTEPTLVVAAVGNPEFLGRYVSEIFSIAETLNQDCIAVYLGGGVGKLIGPRAEAWGEFNPAYFIDIDGNRLA